MSSRMPSKLSCTGLFAGLVLLGVASVLFVTKSSSMDAMDASGRMLQEVACGGATDCECDGSSCWRTGHYPASNNAWHLQVFQTTNILVWYGILIGQILIGVIFAVLYKQRAVDPVVTSRATLTNKKMQPAEDFEHGIFGCTHNPWVCFHGLCCPMARMAATNEVSGVLGYWPTVGVWCVATCFSGCCGPSIVTLVFRVMLKKIMNIKENILFDIVIACCCPCLSICQQATAVDHAMGYEVVGCCDIEWQGSSVHPDALQGNCQSMGAAAKSPSASPVAVVV